MPEEDAELAELQRRVYGPDADLHGDPTAVARLAGLRRAMLDAREEADPRREATSEGDPWTPVREQGDPGRGAGPPAMPGGDGSAMPGGGAPARPGGDGSAMSGGDGSAEPGDRSADSRADGSSRGARRSRVAVLVGFGALAVVFIAAVAGGLGWSGGFLAGWASAGTSPDARMSLEARLTETALSDDARDEMGDLLLDPATGERMDGTEYYGTFGDGAHVMVTDTRWFMFPGGPDDRTCLQILEATVEDDGDQVTRTGTWVCGSARLGVTADVFVTDAYREGQFSQITAPEFAPGTLLRFVYDAETASISVWSLPPAEG